MTKTKYPACRSCGKKDLELIIDFGRTPLADRLVTHEQMRGPEITAPLTLVFCPSCSLVQITESVSPEILFGPEYPYFSSVSPSLLKHFRESAEYLIAKRKLNAGSLVIEAASNDGYLLKNFREKGIPVLGIDPAQAPAQKAQADGVPTIIDFFGKELAKKLRHEEGKAADVFLANNVLAHVPDLNGFVEGIKILLKEDGVAVIECPYLVDLVDHCEFDTIYHQHLCYFSITALDRLFRRHGLYLNDVKRTSVHGGSLRLFVQPFEKVTKTVKNLLVTEKKRKVDKMSYYRDFAHRVEGIKSIAPGHTRRTEAQRTHHRIVRSGRQGMHDAFVCGTGQAAGGLRRGFESVQAWEVHGGESSPHLSAGEACRRCSGLCHHPGMELRRGDHEAAGGVPEQGGQVHRAHPQTKDCIILAEWLKLASEYRGMLTRLSNVDGFWLFPFFPEWYMV